MLKKKYGTKKLQFCKIEKVVFYKIGNSNDEISLEKNLQYKNILILNHEISISWNKKKNVIKLRHFNICVWQKIMKYENF